MCYMCMILDDVFAPKVKSDRERLRERAAQVKKLVNEAETRKAEISACDMGEAWVDVLKEEQYELARQL